ncbi:MAG: sigma-70 family RNA polymerase sigma factor [Blastocatellia bacterium]|nr:sigma-70 family RNA polymerase sigma factor [Blastocatellia bacterium]
MTPKATGDLIQRIKAGDKESFWHLAEPHYKSLLLTAYSLLRDADEAAEVVQETMLKALKNFDQLKDTERFRAWLTSIAINEARQRIRKRHPEVQDMEASAQDSKEFVPRDYADWRDIPSDALEKKEFWDAVHSALESLSPICREVFVLRDIQHFTISEAARILDIPEANVSLRLHRARLQMRELLTPLFRDPVSPWIPLVMMADMPAMMLHRVVRCKTAIRELSKYIDSQLDPTLRNKIENHLKYCRRCKILLDTTRKLLYIVADERVFLPPFTSNLTDWRGFQE